MTAMTSRLGGRGWAAIGVGAALALLLGTWFLVVGPARSDAAGLRDDAATVDTQNTSLSAKITALKRESEHRTALADQVASAIAGLPPGTNLPVFSRQLAAQAAKRGVDLTGFSVGAAVAPGDEAAASGTTTATAQLLAIPVTITSTGPALAQLYFLRDVQQVGPRLALVTSTSVAPGQETGDADSIADSSTLTVQLTVFTHRLPRPTKDQLAGLLGTAPQS